MQYNSEEFNEILRIFKIEADEIIQYLNDGFLLLEKNPTDKTPLKRLFQLAHSLKGAGRMIGFNSIQDIAHKIEDVLAFWQKESVEIKVDSFQAFYNALDFLSFLVKKSVEQKSNYFDEKVSVIISELHDFISVEEVFETNKIVIKENYIEQKSVDINAIILELMFVLDKEEENTVEDILLIFNDNISQLNEIFQETEYAEIKEKIADLDSYLKNKNSNEIYFSVCKEKFLDIKGDIHSLYKELNIKPNYKPSNNDNPQEKLMDELNLREKVLHSLDYLVFSIQKVKIDNTVISDFEDKFQKIMEKISNTQALEVLQSAVKILRLFADKGTTVNNDSYLIILQSLYLAKRILLHENENNQTNINSLRQRISVVEDMYNAPKLPVKVDNKEVYKKTLSELKSSVTPIEIQEIKTHRVDTSKIDNLVSKTGELLINGLKTREHISELSKISSKLIDWNSNNKAILNYIKYLEKRGIFSEKTDESAYAFFKKMQGFFNNNLEMINDVTNDLNKLHNLIFEDDTKLNQTAKEVETIATNIRVLSLATLFHSFPRMVRDIAKEKNKKIDFVVTGSDTTVDKKIIEEIKMPLIHILRNAVSHGIETPEVRVENGKDETGIVKLSAKIVENNLILTMIDDGYGINLLKVKKSAIDKGLLTLEEAENISDEQLMKLLFLPGFSTQESVSDISGRGIGLDIVKTKITNLNGEISIDSELNKGCAVTIKIPLSMSMIKTFLLNVNNQKFAIPISSIKYVLKIKKDEIFNKNGKDCILYEGASVPIYNLSNVFEGEADFYVNNDVLTVIIIENQERIAAFIADELLGDMEVFHKKLVPPILKIKNISGFTTLSTGEICLIINPFELIRNTVMGESISLLSLKNVSLTDKYNELKNKKIVLFDKNNHFDIISTDIQALCNSVNIFNNINSIYDYIMKNSVDYIICNIDNDSEDVVRLIKYIKSDESFVGIKWIIFSNLSEYEVSEKIQDYGYNLYYRFKNYQKDDFAKQMLKLV